MKHFTSKNQKLGEYGELLAGEFLIKKGFTILEKNYTKKVGEIDIVAVKGDHLHFVEVKSLVLENVSHETKMTHLDRVGNVPRETLKRVPRETLEYTPFQNVSRSKLKKFGKTVSIYLSERRVSHETKWCIDVIAVVFIINQKKAKIDVLWNVT